MKQKLFTLLLAIIASMGTTFAWDYVRVKIGSLYYNLDDKNRKAEVTSKNNELGGFSSSLTITSASIPSSVSYSGKTYQVTAIGDHAFRNCSTLKSVTIPNCITSIGAHSFWGCTGLTSVTIPNSVTSIGGGAFMDCIGLTSITIPNSVTSIGGNAFQNCSHLPIENNIRYAGTYLVEAVNKTLSSYSIKSGTKWIGSSAFRDCSNLISITIPNSVTSIASGAFSGCTGLTSVTLGNSVTSIEWKAFENCSGLTSVSIGNSVTIIEGWAFSDCSGLTSVTIGNSVTSIGEYAFRNCTGLTSVTIGNSVTYIGEYAFSGCSGLTSVTIPNSVTSIEWWAFSGCTGLTSVSIGNSVTNIGSYAFENSGVETINFIGSIEDWCNKIWSPNSISSNYQLLFNGVIQKNVIIPSSVTSIGNNAFSGCTGLTSVTIPNSVTSIGNNAFYNVLNIVYSGISAGSPWGAKCRNGYIDGNLVYSDETKTILKGCSNAVKGTISIPNSVTSIGSYAFAGCSGLTSVTIPNSVTSIGEHAFNNCSGLTSVTIGNSVTSIGGFAFSDCSGLTSVTIGNSVTSIGEYAFRNCTGLTSVVWNAKNCADFIGNDTPFYRFNNNFDLRSQITSFTFGDEVEHIPTFLCSGMPNLTSVTIPNSVTSIGESAFAGCTGLTSVSIGNSVTSIGYYAFENSSVETINFIGSIEDWCNKIWSPNCISSNYQLLFNGVIQKNVIIPSSVTSIGNNAFSGCTGLTSVTIPNSVTSIGNNVFSGCNSLTSVAINSPDIVGKTYSSSSNIKNIFGSQVTQYIIGDDVTSIGMFAFMNCGGLTSVTIPNSVTSIGGRAFRGCTGLTSVTIPNSVTSIGDYAFDGCTGLTSVKIGNSVTSIGYYAFSVGTGLASVTCLASTPPNCKISSFSGVNCSNIPLYVPMESVSLYQAAKIWKEFNVIGVMFADEVETAVFSATPTDDYGVILEWQAVENAILYNIDIIQGNDTIRKLQFDSNGKLLNSPSNAPSRYPNIHHASTAILSGNGWRCEVNDLDPGTNYTYSITVKAENGSVLYSQSIGFTTKEETFIIKFVNWNGEELLVLPEVVKGTTPSYTGETPVRPNTAEYTYTFVGWTPAIVAATSDTTYTATYTATKNSYTITWQNEDGSLIDQTTVEYGVVPTHAEPTKQATAEYTYTFTGWTPAVVAVTGDATYKATFTAKKNSYTITWQNEDGSLIDQTTVEYGVVPTHADPVKQNTAEYTYTFAGWTPAVVAVTGDATYKATFTATKNSYTITWLDEDGSLIDQTTVEYGVVPTHAEPTKEATAEYTYTFAGWTPAVVAVTGDATYKATFSSVVNVYTISVSAVNGQVIGGGECQYGATIDLTAIPNEGYVFDQWSDGVKDNPRTITVTGDAEYTALFTSTEGFENIYTSEPVQKVIINQKVYILRGDKIYNAQGALVK